MTALHIDRPCQVRRAGTGRWEWTCLCSPAVWPCTGREATFDAALAAADSHLTTAHPAPQPAVLAPVIELAAFRRPAVLVAAGDFGGEAA
ncbi:hypothetical protein ACXC9Q_18760 [Kribbella sp. CWNU-51]